MFIKEVIKEIEEAEINRAQFDTVCPTLNKDELGQRVPLGDPPAQLIFEEDPAR